MSSSCLHNSSGSSVMLPQPITNHLLEFRIKTQWEKAWKFPVDFQLDCDNPLV